MRSAPCTSPPPAARIRGKVRTGCAACDCEPQPAGCKIPGANMTAKERARQAGIRRNPPSQTGTRKHVPPYGNARTIRRQRVPDRRPLSRRLAALHAFLEKKPRAAARQNAKSTSRILGARKRKRHPECARPEQLPHISEHRAVNGPATGTPSARTSGPNAEKALPATRLCRGKGLSETVFYTAPIVCPSRRADSPPRRPCRSGKARSECRRRYYGTWPGRTRCRSSCFPTCGRSSGRPVRPGR